MPILSFAERYRRLPAEYPYHRAEEAYHTSRHNP